jgi:microcystin-dependent protein
MSYVFTNKAITFLDTALSSVSGTILLASGEGALFPTPTGGNVVPLVLEDRLTGTFEIVYCTARTGDQLTVTRAQEGTAATSWAAGDLLSLRATAGVYAEFASYDPRISSNETDIIQAENAIAQLQIDVAALQAQILQNIYPVGSLYMSTLATNPNVTMGFGTWTAHAQGRALVGVGNNGESSWTVGQQTGSEQHVLVTAEIPAHQHVNPQQTLNINSAGSHTHPYIRLDSTFAFNGRGDSSGLVPTGTIANNTSAAGAHTHTGTLASFSSNAVGSDQGHNNIQPSIGVYVWRRTA